MTVAVRGECVIEDRAFLRCLVPCFIESVVDEKVIL